MVLALLVLAGAFTLAALHGGSGAHVRLNPSAAAGQGQLPVSGRRT
jgi:hypothetical protein